MKPRFGMCVPPCVSPKKMAEFAQRLEDQGWGYVWVPDSQLLWRDLYVTMAFCGASTSRISLGPAVTNPLTRDASVTACATATVDEITNGRTILGIGAGDSSVTTIGFRPATVATCRKYVQTVKSYFRGETALDFAEKFCMVGRPVDVIEKIERLRKRGINSFYLRHLFSYDLPETEAKVFSEEIIPSLS